MKIKTLTEFKQKAKYIHGDLYNYDKVVYLHSWNKVTILCNKHGEFDQVPYAHLRGQGCPICKIEKRKTNIDIFVQKAHKIHSNKYNYSLVDYINAHTKITIICPEHGKFNQVPNSHLNGNGCSKCGFEKTRLMRLYTQEEFIEKAKCIHNNKYDYSNVVYINGISKVYIICPDHGEFSQTPEKHLAGRGCPICRASKGELAIKTILDKYKIYHQQEYRIPEIGNKLYYDFYLPEYNLLIEFHGRQHYEYIPFLHKYDELNFLAQKDRDKIVENNARLFKYRFIEFNYKQLKTLSSEEFENFVLNKLNLDSTLIRNNET